MRPVNISASRAKEYYYEKDPVFNALAGQENTQWHGRGAEALGLQGHVGKVDFEAVLYGRDPKTNEQLVQVGGHEQSHRAGTDIPFSAPKSVSLAALVDGDQRLIDAHDKAVASTIAEIEKDCAMYRETINGITQAKVSSNFVVSTFRHSTSRENDPQLHSHSLIFNMTQDKNGAWKATFNDAIFRDQQYVTSIYLNELAKEVKALGWGIEQKSNGTWELSGISQERIELFSKRSEAIREKEIELRDSGKFTTDEGTLNKVATLDSRPDKDTSITADQLRDSWKVQDAELSLKTVRHIDDHHKSGRVDCGANEETIRPKATEYDIIRLAIQQKQETESCFTKADILKQANRLSGGEHGSESLKKAYEELQNDKEIIKIGEEKSSKGLKTDIYSTPLQIRIEKNVIKSIEDMKGKALIVFDREDISNFITGKERESGIKYTKDQKAAAITILGSKDNTVIVQGDAGVGKTTSMQVIKEFAHNNDVEVRGLAFTGKAVAEMQNAGISNSQTIDSFLLNKRDQAVSGREIWIIDEASMVGSKQGLEVLKIAEKAGVKVALVGDVAQKQSITAGRFFKDIQEKTTVDKVVMQESKRFKTDHQKETVQYLKDAAKHIKNEEAEKIKEHIGKAIEAIDKAGNFREIKDQEGMREEAVRQYFELTQGGKSALVLTKTNAERHDLNENIREEKVERGEIERGKVFTVKDVVNIQAERATFADSYKTGQTILFRERTEAFKRGEKAEITSTDREQNTITLAGKDGQERVIDLKQTAGKFSVYQDQEREFSAGDKIVFLENDKKLVNNGSTGLIQGIDERGNCTVVLDSNKKEVFFNLTENLERQDRQDGDAKYSYNKVDHGYAVTVEKSQGATTDKSIYLADTDNSKSINFNDFNVAVTRAREDSVVITNDRGKFSELISREQEKTSTIDHEILIEAEDTKSDIEISKDSGIEKSGKGRSREIELTL